MIDAWLLCGCYVIDMWLLCDCYVVAPAPDKGVQVEHTGGEVSWPPGGEGLHVLVAAPQNDELPRGATQPPSGQ